MQWSPRMKCAEDCVGSLLDVEIRSKKVRWIGGIRGCDVQLLWDLISGCQLYSSVIIEHGKAGFGAHEVSVSDR
jgi:hypothetical protein